MSGAGNSQTEGELPGKCGGGQDRMWTYNKGIYIPSDNVLPKLQLYIIMFFNSPSFYFIQHSILHIIILFIKNYSLVYMIISMKKYIKIIILWQKFIITLLYNSNSSFASMANKYPFGELLTVEAHFFSII